MLTYPSGTKFKHDEFNEKNIKLGLQLTQVVDELQSSQFIVREEHKEQIPLAVLL